MNIRCICYNLSIPEILAKANEHHLKDIESIKEMLHICDKCQLCNPYIEKELNELSSPLQ